MPPLIALNFALPRLLPGDPLTAAAQPNLPALSAEQERQLRATYHLDQPIPTQFQAYLADLIQEEARRHQDELATEGYRALSADTASFASAAWPLAAAVWSEWDSQGSGATVACDGEEKKGA